MKSFVFGMNLNLASSDDGKDFLSRASSEMRTEEEKVSNAPKIKEVKI